MLVAALLGWLLAGEAGLGTWLGTLLGVLAGFAGVALLLLPGNRPSGVALGPALIIVGAAASWGFGSFPSPRLQMPPNALSATGWQMLLGGAVTTVAGIAIGELGDAHPSNFSGDSVLAFAYLVVVGSIVAFSAYAWLLRNVPVSKVGTYAYVNPAVAVVLGWWFLGERLNPTQVLGTVIIIGGVVLVTVASRRKAAH